MSLRSMQARYLALQARLRHRLAEAVTAAGVDTTREAAVLAARFGLAQERRAAAVYKDIAGHLLSRYPPEMAYAIAVEINEQLERKLGYPPIGQIMVAMEKQGGEGAARWIGCALRNFPRIETAQLAFGVIKSSAMRSLVRAELAAEDSALAEYICAGGIDMPVPTTPTAEPVSSRPTEWDPGHGLSDGIGRMPRQLTDAERRGDRLFLHLQAIAVVVVLLLPILGGVLRGWTGATVGLVTGWCTRVWMRRSMGIRSSNPHDGFFIRVRERANGARGGLLEILIERVRRRSFTQEQCTEIKAAWDETRQLIEEATSKAEKGALVDKLDARIKRISYDPDG